MKYKMGLNKKNLPLVLCILDGWGIWKEKKGNAVAQAHTPAMDSLSKNYPNILINASGKYVGLPESQPGNSEAGHMNIGAGRCIEQDDIIISKSISNGTFFKNPAFLQAAHHVVKNNSDIHLMGLLCDQSSPHSEIDHLLSLISFFTSRTKARIYLHLFTDGRDSPKFAALKILQQYKNVFNNSRVKIATVMGRFYAMDRKKAWERTRVAYETMILGRGHACSSAIEAVNQAYNRQESDEFISPSVMVLKSGQPVATIQDNDAIVFFNLRSDRARQLAKVFVQKDFGNRNKNSFHRAKKLHNLLFVALTDFGPDLDGILTAYPGMDIPDTLPLALSGLRQAYIAETEKYAHVTYFLNGGYKYALADEAWINIPSKDVDSYDKMPQMSTREVAKRVVKAVDQNEFDFVLVNFASPDMVGHTGNLEAAVKAVEIVDKAVADIQKAVLNKKGTLIVTADHGNVEEMINLQTGEIDTEHSTNLVPFIIASQKKYKLQKSGSLTNISPTILDILGMPKPKHMTGKSLIKK